MSITLYGAYWSVHTQRVLMTLYEKNIADVVVFKEVAWDQRLEAWYVKLQPFAKFPVLVDARQSQQEPFVLFESLAIVEYLNEQFADSGKPLAEAPNGSAIKRAQQRQWQSVESTTLYPLFHAWVRELLWNPKLFNTATDPKELASIVQRLQRPLTVISDALTSDGRDYLAGDISIVDIAIAPFFNRLGALPAAVKELEKFPAVMAWWKRIEARPSWQQVIRQDNFITAFKLQ